MFSLHLTCQPEDLEALSFALWEAGTVGIREEERSAEATLIAGFEDGADRDALAAQFAAYQPDWQQEDETNWVTATEESWPGREVGDRIFLAPVWNKSQTPKGRTRVIHNPGLASGTGEHPCTQLALESLEQCLSPGAVVVDIGTGSGILAIAALRLGARLAVGLDVDFPSLATARENFELNKFGAMVAAGSADCVASEAADVVVANISGTVLLSIADDLLRIGKAGGRLILTGFPESELAAVRGLFGGGDITAINEWRCLTLALS